MEDLTQHPLMLAEPTFNTRELRERLTEIVFEQFGSPALFLAKNAALSAYATGRQTALVADAGHEGTVGEPVCLFGGSWIAYAAGPDNAVGDWCLDAQEVVLT